MDGSADRPQLPLTSKPSAKIFDVGESKYLTLGLTMDFNWS